MKIIPLAVPVESIDAGKRPDDGFLNRAIKPSVSAAQPTVKMLSFAGWGLGALLRLSTRRFRAWMLS